MTICGCHHNPSESTMEHDKKANDMEQSESQYARTLLRGSRTVGYTVFDPSEASTTAILIFYPIGGSSHAVNYWADSLKEHQYPCRVLCVDRPNCGQTSSLLDVDDALYHIQESTQDVMAVLRHEGIQTVYVLGACLGHVFAIELCRQLLQMKNQSSQSAEKSIIELKGIVLVAPFVATQAPHSWWVARLGASVPSWLLKSATNMMTAVSPWLLSSFMTPTAIEKMVTPEEQEEFGWNRNTPNDFQDACQMIIAMDQQAHKAKAIEARLGTSSVWQEQVLDQFAIESGFGLNIDEAAAAADAKKEGPNDSQSLNGSSGHQTKAGDETKTPPPKMRIYACPTDTLVPLPALEWLAERCYGGTDNLTILETVKSHNVMILFGGPPRNPVLLHRIAREEWGLLQS